MKHIIICLTLLIACSLLPVAGCKKPAEASTTSGGKGGDRTIKVSPEHHGIFVDTCTVYIKYNTQDAPLDNVYDDSLVCVMMDTIPVAVFTNLKVGDYYLFARGYHTLYVPPYVKGGLPCKIRTEDTVKIILPTYSYGGI